MPDISASFLAAKTAASQPALRGLCFDKVVMNSVLINSSFPAFTLLSTIKKKLAYCIFRAKDSAKLWKKNWEVDEAIGKEVLWTCPMSSWLMYHWFKLLENHAMTAKELVSAFPYLLTSTNTAFEIFMQCPNRQCNSLFMVMAQPWANKWASLIRINNCKINCSRGDSESHSFFTVFAVANQILHFKKYHQQWLLFLHHESCNGGTRSPMNETLTQVMVDNARKT